MATVTLQQLAKRYHDQETLRGIDLEVRDGEFLVLVGPSGCGKSTLLRMIAGLEAVSAGQIHIADRVVNDVAPADRGVAMVFQSYALYPHMSVRDNMAFGLKMARLPKAEQQQRISQAATMLQLEALLQRKPAALSGGQRQRVAIGRAIVRQPQVFLFDEPLSNLDAKLRDQMRLQLSQLHKRLGTTMIYVTHDQKEAMTLAERIVVMRDGNIEQVGTPLELYHQPANRFVAGFIGSPCMNFLPVSVAEGSGGGLCISLPWQQQVKLPYSLPGLQPGDRLELGVRPYALHIDPASRWQLQLDVTEQLGHVAYLHGHLDGTALVVESDHQAATQVVNGKVGIRLDISQCHLFDQQGQRLVAPQEQSDAA